MNVKNYNGMLILSDVVGGTRRQWKLAEAEQHFKEYVAQFSDGGIL